MLENYAKIAEIGKGKLRHLVMVDWYLQSAGLLRGGQLTEFGKFVV